MAEEAQSQIQRFLQECRAEREQTQKELKEVGILIQQITDDVDKLARRHAEIANRIRQMENNFDTVPRADIKNIYTAAQREQGRLFTMRGQLEKLQGRQESLQKYGELLANVLGILDQVGGDTGQAVAPDAGFTTAQSMIVRIIEAQESEKERLSRQMHDGPAQRLTNLILQAEICQRLLDTDPERARVELENLKEAVNKTFQRTREFIADLRPMMLDDLGLVPTLKKYVNTWKEKTGIEAEFTPLGKAGDSRHRLSRYTEVTIFRAVQELIKNAEEHANPSRVQVTLRLDGQTAQAIVEDDGVGFDVDAVMAATDERKTIGIASHRERVEMLGGTLRFESVLGRGTKAILEIPET